MRKTIRSASRQSNMIPWLILMFLFTLNFLSAGGYILLVLIVIYTVLHIREFSFRAAEIALFVFAVEYFLFYFLLYRSAGVSELFNYLIAPWLLYWMGRNMAYRSRDNNIPLKTATALALGFFTYGLLCVIYSMYFAPPTMGSRVLYKFWDQTTLSVTAGGLLFPMALGLSLGHLTTKNRIWSRLFWLGILGVCLYYAFTWAHRSTIYIIAILAIYNYLAFLLTANTTPVQKAALLVGSGLIVATAILCLVLDAGGCYTWLQSQWLYQRLTDPLVANSTSRFVIWKNFFKQWLLYPLGGRQFRISSAYVHNMWLDVYYLCGALPFIALVMATIIIIRHFLQYRSTKQDPRCAHILTNLYIAAFMAFMVEPVIGANPYVFLAMILISGCVDGAVLRIRKQP